MYIYIYTYIYIYISGLARPQGRQKTKKYSAEFISKHQNQKGPARTLLYLNVADFCYFLHARNKGFPLSDCHQTLYSGSTIILPLLAKFEVIRSSRTEDMSR